MTDEQLEAELDQLFQLHPAEMVKARNALVAQLRKHDRKTDAARVKELVRPSLSAWALNRLHVTQPALLEQAQAQAARVRALHADQRLDPAQLRQAMAAQRAAVATLVAAAERCCASADIPYGPSQQRKLLATIQGWLAGMGDQAPGRMTHDLEPGGFEGLQIVAGASVTPSTSTAVAKASDAAASAMAAPSTEALRARKLAQARQELEHQRRRAEQALAQAQAQATRCQSEHEAAAASLQDLTLRLRNAERVVTELSAQRMRSEAKLHEHAKAAAQAADSQVQAEAALVAAQQKLKDLDG